MAASTVLAVESLAVFWQDAQALLAQHCREISAYPDIPLSVDRAFYEQAEASGRLCIVTARREGVLVGYAVFFIAGHPHYSTSLQASQDVFYVDPAARGTRIGLQLLARSESVLRALGCQVVHHHVKLKHPALGRLLLHDGYAVIETIYSKRLDAEGR